MHVCVNLYCDCRYRAVAESKFDWDACGVPEALTDEKIRANNLKEKEKKKRLKAKKKNTKNELKALEEAKIKEEEAKRLLEIEQCGVCDQCEKSLYKNKVYNIFDKSCCSSDCVVLLRRKLAAAAAESRMKKL
jgi:hypothetical protein